MMNDSDAKKVAQVSMGAAAELARRSGHNLGSSQGHAMKYGEQLVKSAAALAPGAIAAVAAGTGTAISVAVALAPVAAVAGVGYGVYRLIKWLDK